MITKALLSTAVANHRVVRIMIFELIYYTSRTTGKLYAFFFATFSLFFLDVVSSNTVDTSSYVTVGPNS